MLDTYNKKFISLKAKVNYAEATKVLIIFDLSHWIRIRKNQR